MNFVAIDFETANRYQTSACSIGLVKFQNGQVIDEFYTLLNPQQPFEQGNIRVHHITPTMVGDAPTFASTWLEIERFIGELPLVAHNASFDKAVLFACITEAGFPQPPFIFHCTVKMARKVWPNLPSRRLSALADYLHIPLHHHHALEDARACGFIARSALLLTDSANFHDFYTHFSR